MKSEKIGMTIEVYGQDCECYELRRIATDPHSIGASEMLLFHARLTFRAFHFAYP